MKILKKKWKVKTNLNTSNVKTLKTPKKFFELSHTSHGRPDCIFTI